MLPLLTNIPRCVGKLCLLATCLLSIRLTRAGTMSASTTAPAVDAHDIANLSERTGEDKFWTEAGTEAGKAKGQTFRTGTEGKWLRSVSYRTNAGSEADPTKTYVVRLGKVSGSTFTLVHTETFSQTTQWTGGAYMTWTFTTPLVLQGDTTYGIDIGMTSSTSSWQTGIPYLMLTDNNYSGGQLYNTGGVTAGVGGTNLGFSASEDRHFHLNLDVPSGTTLAFITGNPADGTGGNLVRPQIVATFNQTITKGTTGDIRIRDITNTAAVTSVSVPITDPRITISGNNLYIASAGLFNWGVKYAVRIDSGAIRGTGGVAFPGWADDATWNFNMAAADPLLAAIAAMKAHINGTTILTAAQIATHSGTIRNEKVRFGDSSANITAIFDLIKTYDTEVGPLWNVGGDLVRAEEAADVPWTIYHAMQGIMDHIYIPSVLRDHEATLLNFKFGSSSRFPGSCPVPPAGQTRTVAINASFLETFGRTTQGWGEPARKPTGTYLAPGTIATVTVPSTLVNRGYQIRVGAHSWDHGNRPNLKRLDRCTLLYDISSTTTKIASPLGGGIYIEVPRTRSVGVVNVTIAGAARSPYFSGKSFHQTTPAEWLVERTHPGPWADFQSEKFMFQVPRSWIYNYADPTTVMANWDKAMDAMNDLMGFPQLRGKETMYDQVDLQLRASVHAPGYPAVNASYNPSTTYNGNNLHYLLTGPQNAPDYEFHEAGHAYFFPKFAGEQESTVNLLHIAVQTQKFGKTFDVALRESNGYNSFCTLPNTAVVWMTSFNFSPENDPMDDWEKSYQPQGHAKFADLARLFGWGGLNNFWFYYNDKEEKGQTVSTSTDSMILQLCKSYGKDVRPMLHFWGIHPTNATTLQTSITSAKLKAPVEIYDRIMQYKALIPTNNATYRTWCTSWWGGSLPSISGFGVEREHARQLSTTLQNGDAPQARFPTEIYDEAAATQVNAQVQQVLDRYYPAGRPTDYVAWDANFPGVDLTSPTADFDKDGLSNDHERIWGLDPTLPSSKTPVAAAATLKSTGNFTYTRRTSTLTALTFTVWTSSNLTTWTRDTGATQTVATTVNNVQTVNVKLSASVLANKPKLYVRVQAAQ